MAVTGRDQARLSDVSQTNWLLRSRATGGAIRGISVNETEDVVMKVTSGLLFAGIPALLMVLVATHAETGNPSAKPVVLTLKGTVQVSLPAKMEGSWDDSGYSGPVKVVNYGNTGENAFKGKFQFGGWDSKCTNFNDFTGYLAPGKTLVLESNGCGGTRLELVKKDGSWRGSASWFDGENYGSVSIK